MEEIVIAEFQNRGRFIKKEEPQYAVNERIRAKTVRVVGENLEPGIYSIEQALQIADDLELDLVEISPTAQPPVCKVVDYQKFIYQQKKKQKEIKSKTAKVIIKEIRFGPQTDEHDFDFKLKHAINFLKEGAKVKAYVFFKGRSILYTEQGMQILKRFAEEVQDYGKVESEPKLEGKRMLMLIAPVPQKVK